MTNFHNRSNEELVSEIETLKAEGLSLYQQISERLTELQKRGYKHPLHRHVQFRHHAAVTAGRLIPAIVVMFDGSKPHMDCFRGRPEDVQRTVAAGREFDVATVRKGEIVESRISVARMNLKTIQRLFPAGASPRSLAEQRRMLESELADQPKTHIRGVPLIRSVPEKGALKIGGTVISVTHFQTALAELGYELRKAS